MIQQVSRQAVIDAAAKIGAAAVGWSCVAPTSRDAPTGADWHRLKGWYESGAAAALGYLNPEHPRWAPGGATGELERLRLERLMLNEAVSTLPPLTSSSPMTVISPMTVVSFAFPYESLVVRAGQSTRLVTINETSTQSDNRGFGRVARYACGPDYHRVLPELLSCFWRELTNFEPGALSGRRWRAVTDAAPILERGYAAFSKLGFVGKNSLLITPGIGSFTLLAEIITDASIEPFGGSLLREGRCGSCSRCQVACPTAALTRDRVVDARRCISYLTIEKRGVLNDWEKRAIGDWVFGCDICQEVCPFNHAPAEGLSELRSAKVQPLVALEAILQIDDERRFQEHFGGTPLERTRRAGLVRNALCVVANQGVEELTSLVAHVLKRDRSPTVRETAAWALKQLSAST